MFNINWLPLEKNKHNYNWYGTLGKGPKSFEILRISNSFVNQNFGQNIRINFALNIVFTTFSK